MTTQLLAVILHSYLLILMSSVYCPVLTMCTYIMAGHRYERNTMTQRVRTESHVARYLRCGDSPSSSSADCLRKYVTFNIISGG